MTGRLLRIAALALGLCAAPALGQQPGRAPGRPVPDRGAADKGASDKGVADRRGGPPVIGCPSLANYRMLMRGGVQEAAAQLADPKADHLGCAPLSRAEITGIVDRVSLAGQSYDCAGIRGTTVCHWIEAGASGRPGPPGR
ncbi:hypothetical protein [Methylobacterium sp. J-070]|uniref:hypothetical protein n=1 Tax=Methylobacterium sp. J-070 TaxID=2836650 RepID=UPI001FB8BE7B|nr:hypothetical protein [Methylobacterium sp. J-070]MCJ2048557.1 hypothetical protein [Methylobacterium sp. J-070]